MLALTENATEAIEEILSAPTVPDEGGVRIAAAAPVDSAEPAVGDLHVTVADSPAESDQVIEEDSARVFVGEEVADYLDDKLLDASISERGVSFAIGEQAT